MVPTADRAWAPFTGPNISTIRSEQPFITDGCCPYRGFENTGTASYKKPEEKSKPSYAVPARPQVKEHVPSENFIASNTADLEAGQKVEHQKFGFGEVVKMEGAAHNPIATINFENNGEKKIMLNYAKLRIV